MGISDDRCLSYLDLPLLEADRRVGFLEVCVGRDHALFQTENALDEASHPSSSFRMPDVGLDRTNHKGLVCGSVFAKTFGNTGQLRWIASLGSGAVALDIPGLITIQAGNAVHLADVLSLGILVGHSDTCAGPR